MIKTSTIVKADAAYEISVLINNIALIKAPNGESGLLNIRTNKIIGKNGKYHTTYDESRKFYTQTREGEDNNSNNKSPEKVRLIRIYDAKNEKMIVEESELVNEYRDYYEIVSVRSENGKLHLFDKYGCRLADSIYNTEVDDIEKIHSQYNDIYFVLIKNGKKALYFTNVYDKRPKLLTGFEYDDIAVSDNIFIFTEEGKKHFRFMGDEENKSANFDELIVEPKNKNIVYGIRGKEIFVYNVKTKELMIQTEGESITYLGKVGDSYNEYYGDYYFKVTKDKKCNLVSASLSSGENNKRKVTQYNIAEGYDNISMGEYSKSFYLEKNKKIGVLVGSGYRNQKLEPAYDDIDNLRGNYFALKNDETCNIAKITSHEAPKTIITDCSIKECSSGYIITKNNKKGILFIGLRKGDKLIDPEYDNITEIAEHYYIVEKNKKLGIIYQGEVIIPVEYDEIRLGGKYKQYEKLKDANKIYFALRKDNEYELAKRRNYQHVDEDVEFVSNHKFDTIEFFREIMVFSDEQYTYIYDYEERLLKTFKGKVEVSETVEKKDGYTEEYFYNIDGKKYYYKNDKFNEVYKEETNIYITTYETNTDIFEIRTANKAEHDALCSILDEQSEEEAEKTLQDYSTNKQKVKSKYPTIQLNRINKND